MLQYAKTQCPPAGESFTSGEAGVALSLSSLSPFPYEFQIPSNKIEKQLKKKKENNSYCSVLGCVTSTMVYIIK